MYKYSWKAALMTFCMMGAGKIALAAGDKDKELKNITSGEAVSGNTNNLTDTPIDISDLSSKVKNLDKQIAQINQNMPPDLLWIIIGLVILILILVFMFVWLKKRVDHANRTIKILREALDHHQRLLEALKVRMDDMPEESVQSASVRKQYVEAPVKHNVSPFMQSKDIPVQASIIPEAKPNPSEKLREKCLEFAEEYNYLQTITGLEVKAVKLDFQRKYNLCGFVCVNAHERRVHPEKLPKFQIHESLETATIWGFKIGNFYVVAPNPRQYVGTDHDYGGMKELFDSNFQSGCTYNKIRLNNVAIMTHDLQIYKQGSLKLS